MDEVRKILERQAEWQKQRRTLTWPEKVRMAEAVRESLAKFSGSGREVKVTKRGRHPGIPARKA